MIHQRVPSLYRKIFSGDKHHVGATPVIPGYDDGSSADTSQDLPSIVFDWEHMVPDYYTVGNPQAKQAVAELMLYCGYAAKLKYGTSGSGGQPGSMANAMINYFDYDGRLGVLVVVHQLCAGGSHTTCDSPIRADIRT